MFHDVISLKMHTGDSLRIIEILIEKLKNCAAGEIYVVYDVASLKMHTGNSLRVIEILNLGAKKLRRRRNFCVS